MLQGHGIAHRLLAEEIDAARDLGATAISLEVRVTNWRAQRVYARFGFHPVGIRRNYYAELHEDALIMWTDDIRERAFRQRVRSIVHRLPEGIRPQVAAR
jgi:ribosomal-protein-alanine N-acetyltransferase